MSGSLYEPAAIEILVAGLETWMKRGVAGIRPRVEYFGADGDRLRAVADGLDFGCEIVDRGYRPLAELFGALGRSRVNIYVRSPRTLFHHKLIELLSCGRPIISINEESPEARRIVTELGGRFAGAANAEELAARLDEAWRSEKVARPPRHLMSRYTWDSQAATLERVMERIIA